MNPPKSSFLSASLVAAMPVYDCHKQVRAMKIASICEIDPIQDACDVILIADGMNQRIWLTGPFMDRHKPEVGGYIVVYEDGFTSYSPQKPFEDGYTLANSDEHGRPQFFGFDQALNALKNGCAVQRSGWNGKGMFVYAVPANSYPAQTGQAKRHFGEGSLVPYGPYFALKGVDGTVNTWVPSISDLFANDWSVVEVQPKTT